MVPEFPQSTSTVGGLLDRHAKAPHRIDGGEAIFALKKAGDCAPAFCQGGEHRAAVRDAFVTRNDDVGAVAENGAAVTDKESTHKISSG